MKARHNTELQGTEESVPGLRLPLKWVIPESISSRFATEMLVQHTDQEFVLSFFETVPPAFFGSPAEQLEQARKMDAVETVCVARIVISAKRMPGFAKAIEKGIERYQRSSTDLSKPKEISR